MGDIQKTETRGRTAATEMSPLPACALAGRLEKLIKQKRQECTPPDELTSKRPLLAKIQDLRKSSSAPSNQKVTYWYIVTGRPPVGNVLVYLEISLRAGDSPFWGIRVVIGAGLHLNLRTSSR